MASGEGKANKAQGPKGGPSNDQILSGFHQLRQQQRATATKISELEMDKKEHDLVIDTLNDVDGDRKCFRMVGGVLVERTVKDVFPALKANNEQISRLVVTLTKQLETRGKDLNEYREKFNIRIRGEDEQGPTQSKKDKPITQGVLVAGDS